MTDQMSIERFQALAQIYGASLERWPPTERGAAERHLGDPVAMEMLRKVRDLDIALHLWVDEQVPVALPGRIAMTITDGRSSQAIAGIETENQAVWHGTVHAEAKQASGIGRLWWLGVGLAAALSGLAAGSVAASTFVQDDPYDVAGTSFGDLPDLEN